MSYSEICIELELTIGCATWENIVLSSEEEFVVDRVLHGGALSHNPSTVRAMRSALNRLVDNEAQQICRTNV
jgi:hypothetical protein